jgi:subtilisin family serine protease
MSKSGLLKRKFPQILLFCVLVLSMSHLVPSLIPDVDVDKGKRLRINVGSSEGAGFLEGEVLVRFKPEVSHHDVGAAADAAQSAVLKRYKALAKVDAREYALLKSKHRTTQQMIEALQKNPRVDAVSPNFLLHIDSNIPNDEYFDYLWGLDNTGQTGGPSDIDINAPEAWDITTGSSTILVGVIDTGIDYNHPDLIPNIWINPGEVPDGLDNDGNGYIDDIHGINAIASSGDPMDDHSHGTHCAGIIGAAGNNSLGVAGINWNVKLVGAKFLDATGYGTDADALECINYMIDLKTTYGQNIVAVNASFGGGDYDPVMESAIDAMGTAGIIFCAAAGNEWMDNDIIPHYPSSYTCSNVLAVTAVDYMGWQNFNYGKTSVDLGAPGIEILSTISAVYYPQAGDVFFDDMESGAGKWETGGTNNTWGITTDQEIFEEPLYPVPSPPHFWSDSPGTDYLPDTDSWLMNASDIDLSGYVREDLFLGFGSASFFEALIDHAYVEVSGDGGSTWHSLMDFTEYAIYWYIPFNVLIPDFVKTSHFRFRFHLVTDYSIEWPGWLIDDVGIGTASYYAYSFKSGTSMAAPHVTGAVALVASLYPTDSVSQRVARILNNVTPLPSLIDTCVTEGMLNLSQAVSLPGIPWDPSPPDGAADVPVNTLLDWNDCGGAESYDVYFGTSPSPSFVGNVTTSSYDPGALITTTTYYWRVVSKNVYGETSGAEWQFTTAGATPNPPVNPTPADGATGVSITPQLDWDDSAGATSYEVYFGTASPPPLSATTTESSYSPGILDYDRLYYWKVVAKNGYGGTDGPEWSFRTEPVPPVDYLVVHGHDFNGDGSSDVSVFRPADGSWYIKNILKINFGIAGDIPVNGDYNGDGTTEVAVWRPSNGRWYIRGLGGAYWGTSGDTPVPGDYDGNGISDIAVWRPSTGTWYIKDSAGSVWGQTGDIPVPGDYDGDGITEIAVWRPSNGRWYIKDVAGSVWGQTGDIPVPGDYDGDGITEIAVWRPSNGRWYIKDSAGSVWGQTGDIPVPGDYDGDGITEIAVWRPSKGRWYIKGQGSHSWGIAGDIPLVR